MASNQSIELCYEIFGEPGDPAIVLLPGMGNQLLLFDEDLCWALVGRGFFVIRMDNRDAGLSSTTAADDEYTLFDMADDVAAVLDAAEVERAVVLGVSLGGMIAQCFAVSRPERTLALVSVMSASGEPGIGTPKPEVRQALLQPPADTPAEQIEIDLAARLLWSNPDWYDEERLRDYFAELHRRAWTPGGGLRQFAAVLRTPDRAEALAALQVPTLVVHGDSDTLITPEAGRRTAELIPGAQYLEIEGMSHDFVYQAWGPLIEAVAKLAAGAPAWEPANGSRHA